MADGEVFVRCFSSFVARLDSRFPAVQDRFVGATSSEEDLFSFLWSLEEAHDCLVLPVPPALKSEAKATALRAEGNAHYRRKAFAEALRCYNQSLLFAPHPPPPPPPSPPPPPPPEVAKDGPSEPREALSFAYANRSAVLLELRQFAASLEDVDRALSSGYPDASRPKLRLRRERCLKAMAAEGGGGGRATPLLSIRRHNPTLARANAEMPATSDAMTLAFAPDRGRHFAARRDIAPGELLISEQCYSSWLLPEYLTTHCLVCLSRCLTPIPCPRCPYVIFCSAQCLSNAQESHHPAECHITGVLSSLPTPWGVALRTVTRASLPRIRRWIPGLRKEEQEAMTSSLLRRGSRRWSRMREELEGLGGEEWQVRLRRRSVKEEEEKEEEGGGLRRRAEGEEEEETGGLDGEGNAEDEEGKEDKSEEHIEDEQADKGAREEDEETKRANGKEEKKGDGGEEGNANGDSEDADDTDDDDANDDASTADVEDIEEEDLYRRIYHVLTNRAKHTPPQLLRSCAAAFCLTKLLQKGGGFFLKEDGTPSAPNEEEAVLVGSVLLRHLLAVKCNAFTVAEVHVTRGDPRPRPLTIALGLSPCVALLNHSCTPSAFLNHCGGGVQALTALRPLAEDEEVTIDYLLGSRGRSAQRRRDRLLEQFGFHCVCDACDGDRGGRPPLPRLPTDAADLLMENGGAQISDAVLRVLARVRTALARSHTPATPADADVEAACELLRLLDAEEHKPTAFQLAAQMALEELSLRRFLHAEVKQGFLF